MPPEVRTREELADLCNRLGYVRAAAVGVDQGAYEKSFMARWKGHRLWLVDPYEPYAHMPFDRTLDMMMAVAALSSFGDRVKFLRLPSARAARYVRETAPQFVYIDGNHLYESVKEDIEAWWPVLAPGGCLAGHDYIAGNGVAKAADEFAAAIGKPMHFTADSPASWYVFKK